MARAAHVVMVFATLVYAVGGVSAADLRLPSLPRTAEVSISKRTLLDLYLTAREAAAALGRYSDMVLLDVRPAEVIQSAGAPAIKALRVPLLLSTPDKHVSADATKRVDPGFTEKVIAGLRARRLGTDATVIVLCVAGLQSARAADLLAESGLDNVYLVVDGFDGTFDVEHSLGGKGWRNEGLLVTRPAGGEVVKPQ